MAGPRCPLTLSDGICYWKDMWHKMNSMRQSRQLCDVTLLSAEEEIFMAHSAVLAASSDKLCALLLTSSADIGGSANSRKIHFKEMPKEVLQTTLDFIYGLKPETVQAFRNLRHGAQILNIGGALEYCDQHPNNEIKGLDEMRNIQAACLNASTDEISTLKNEYIDLSTSDIDREFNDVQAMPFCPKQVCLPGGCEASYCNRNLSEILCMDTGSGIKLQSKDLLDETLLHYDNPFLEDSGYTINQESNFDFYSSSSDLPTGENVGLISNIGYLSQVSSSASNVSNFAPNMNDSVSKVNSSVQTTNSLASKVWRINAMQTSDLDFFSSSIITSEFENCKSEDQSNSLIGQPSTANGLNSSKNNPINYASHSTNQLINIVASASNKSPAEFLSSNSNIMPVSHSVQSTSGSLSKVSTAEFCKLPDEYVTNHCHGLIPPRDPVHDALVPRLSSSGNSSIECPHLKKVFGESTTMDRHEFDDLTEPADAYNAEELTVDISLDGSGTLSASNPSSCVPSLLSDDNYDFEPSSIGSSQSQSPTFKQRESSSYRFDERQTDGNYKYYMIEDSISSISSPTSIAVDSLNINKSQNQFPVLRSFSLPSNKCGSSTIDIMSNTTSLSHRVWDSLWDNEARQEKGYSSSQHEPSQRMLTIAGSSSVNPQTSCNLKISDTTRDKSINLHSFKEQSISNYTTVKIENELHVQKRSSPSNVLINCEDCEAVLENISKLRMHQLKVHGKGRLFTCSKCDFRSPRKKDVQAHLLSQHETLAPGVRVYGCTVCSYQCIDKNRFEEHEAMHSGEAVHKCTLCGKGYTTRRGMRTHLKYHSTSRPHQCNVCGAAFKVRAKLVDHVKLLHEQKGVKPYQCGYCSHTTALRGNCNQHIRKNHPGQPLNVIDLHAGRRRAVKDYDYAGLRGAEIYEDDNVSVLRTL